MNAPKSKSRTLEWLLGLGVLGLCWSAYNVQPPAEVVPIAKVAEAPRREPAPAPPPKPTFADSLHNLPANTRVELAKALSSLGLNAPAERREAYALALAMLDAFPKQDPAAAEAAMLARELLARQRLPAADKRPVSDDELFEYFIRVLKEPVDGAAPPTNAKALAAQPRAHGAKRASESPSQVLARSHAGDGSSTPPQLAPRPIPAPTYAPPAYTYVPSNPGGEVHVEGHFRSNGTYVQPYTRSAPRR